jgi:hypothetical protein
MANTRKKSNKSLRKTRKKLLGKTDLINVLNRDFQEMMQIKNKHFFFYSIKWFKQNYNEWKDKTYKLKNKANSIHYNAMADLSLINPVSDCKFMPSKTLTPTYLKKFYEKLIKIHKYTEIQAICNDMSNYALPSPLKSLDSWKQSDDSNAINIMILGTGPLGLFTALYLQNYYKDNIYNISYSIPIRKVNVILVDNRIYKEGIKMPYSRSTKLGFSIQEIQPFLKQIFCWNNMDTADDYRAFDYIHVLENLLYTVAYNQNIPMIFTKRFDDYDTLKSFISKEDIHVLFDCTGGRTSIPVSSPVKWNKISLKEGNQEVIQNPSTKYYEFCEDGKVFTTQVFRLQLFGKGKKEILAYTDNNLFAEPTDPEDMALATKYNNMCFETEDYLILASNFKKEAIRNLFPYMLDTAKLKKKDIKMVKVVVFDTIARHSPFVAAQIDKGCTLIRVGDSLGGTEYGIMFGMKHSIEFSRHICNLLSTFL